MEYKEVYRVVFPDGTEENFLCKNVVQGSFSLYRAVEDYLMHNPSEQGKTLQELIPKISNCMYEKQDIARLNVVTEEKDTERPVPDCSDEPIEVINISDLHADWDYVKDHKGRGILMDIGMEAEEEKVYLSNENGMIIGMAICSHCQPLMDFPYDTSFLAAYVSAVTGIPEDSEKLEKKGSALIAHYIWSVGCLKMYDRPVPMEMLGIYYNIKLKCFFKRDDESRIDKAFRRDIAERLYNFFKRFLPEEVETLLNGRSVTEFIEDETDKLDSAEYAQTVLSSFESQKAYMASTSEGEFDGVGFSDMNQIIKFLLEMTTTNI